MPGTDRSRLIDEALEWPPPADKARAAALTVAERVNRDEVPTVLDMLGLREVL
jgi:hypothetical protein